MISKDEKKEENINIDSKVDDLEDNLNSNKEHNALEAEHTEEESKKELGEANEEGDEENHDNLKDLEDQIEKAREEKLRLLAEMDNLRKRTDRDRIDSLRYGSFNLARDILSPDDNLTRALDSISKEDMGPGSNLIDGLKMVQKEFSTILEKHGVKKIDALNKKFDHNFHQAMVEIENDEVDEGMVIQEMQSGYIMHDRLLRPSMVGVSKKSIKNIKETNETDKKD